MSPWFLFCRQVHLHHILDSTYKWYHMVFVCDLLTDTENRLVVAKGEREGVGWTGSLRLVDANHYILNGEAMRSYCTAQGTLSNHL